jgi:NADH:ubiquinone oxidoreductase subunit E
VLGLAASLTVALLMVGLAAGTTVADPTNLTATAVNHITIAPASQTITAGDTSLAYTAEGYDALNHDLGNKTDETTFNIDNGSCNPTTKTCTSTLAGNRTVTGTVNGSISASATLTVVADEGVSSIAISPKTATIPAGGSQAYTATSLDQYGNSIGDVTDYTSFSIVGGSCAGAVCTSTVAAAHAVTGTYLGRTDTATLTVTAGALASIAISPKTATIPAGGSQAYTATSLDQYGNSIGDVTADTSFSIAGGSCTGAVCTSTVAAVHAVTGTYLGRTDTAVLTVGIGGVPVLVISPNPATIGAGDTQAFTAKLYDGFGNFVADETGSMVFTIDGAGTCNGNVCGSNVAGTYTVTGTYSATPNAVAAGADPSAPIIGTATLIVTAAPATPTVQPTIVIGGATGTPRAATPPPTNTGDGSSGGAPMPLFALLLCSAFGVLGMLAVQAQRPTIRH